MVQTKGHFSKGTGSIDKIMIDLDSWDSKRHCELIFPSNSENDLRACVRKVHSPNVVRDLLLTFCPFWNLPLYILCTRFFQVRIHLIAGISDSSDVCEYKAACEKSDLKSIGVSGEGQTLVVIDGTLNTKSLSDSIREESDWLDCTKFESNGTVMLTRSRSELWNVWVNSCSEGDIIFVVLFVDFSTYSRYSYNYRYAISPRTLLIIVLNLSVFKISFLSFFGYIFHIFSQHTNNRCRICNIYRVFPLFFSKVCRFYWHFFNFWLPTIRALECCTYISHSPG